MVLFEPSVVALTVAEISGLNIPAAKPIVSIVNAIPENDLKIISIKIDGRR